MATGLIDWSNPGSSSPAQTGFSSGVIDWGGMYQQDQAQKQKIQQAYQQEQQHLQSIQQAKGISNPGSLLDLQTKLATGQISKDDFLKGFASAAQQNNPAPYKATPMNFIKALPGSAKDLGTGIAKGLVQSENTAATGIARDLPGGTADIQANQNQSAQAAKDAHFISTLQKSGAIDAPTAQRLLQNTANNASAAQQTQSKTVKAMPTKGQLAAGFAGTAADILTGGTLPELKGASTAAKVVRGGTTAGSFGAAAGLNAAAGGGNKKQIAENAIAGALFPMGLKAVGKGVEAARVIHGEDQGVNSLIKNTKAAKLTNANIPEPAAKAASTAESKPNYTHYTTTVNAKSIQDNGFKISKTKSSQGDGVYLFNGDRPAGLKMGGDQKLNVSISPDAKILDTSASDYKGPSPTSGNKLKDYAVKNGYHGVTDGAQTVIYDTSKIKTEAGSKGMGEAGSIAPGQILDDTKAMIAKHQTPTKFSGDVQRGADSVEGTKKLIQQDAQKLIKNRESLSNSDKALLQDYRDKKAAGLNPDPLPAHLQAHDAAVTELNKQAQKADAELARLNGNLQKAKTIEAQDPSTYTHREAQGKGGALDYLLQGDRKSPVTSAGFGKSKGSNKARTLMAVTDENGNRQVVSIKTQTGKAVNGQKISKPNQIVAINGKNQTLLGSLPSKVNMVGRKFEGKDGKTYTIGDAMQSEITKATGQKYYVDPHLMAVKNYVEARSALENARFIESVKTDPVFEKVAAAPGTTAPKSWKSLGLQFPQFAGYRFDPKVADTLKSITSGYNEKDALDKIGKVLRQTIVYFPVKHDLNMLAAFATDRGISGVINPVRLVRGTKALYDATREVIHQGPIYRELLKNGFSLVSADNAQFQKAFEGQLKNLVEDKSALENVAKQLGTTPKRLVKAYNETQHVSVWMVQDILNVARVMERMQGGLLKKGASLEKAIKETERFNYQYKVGARAAGSKNLANVLKSDKVFFGRYKYDQFKILGNIMKDSVNIVHPVKAAQAWDKLAALLTISLILWPEVNKGIQKLSGNPNANMKAPGPAELPETVQKLRTGKEEPGRAASNLLYLGPIQTALDVKNNTDSFTGKKIRDVNASSAQQVKQVGDFLKGSVAPVQRSQSLKNTAGNKAVNIGLMLAGTNFPKNSPEATKLNSLKYDSLPNVQKQVKAAKNHAEQSKIISQYNNEVLKAAQAWAKATGKPVPSKESLRKGGYFYAPKTKTLNDYLSGKKAKSKAGAFTP